MTAPAPTGLLRRLVARAMTAGPATPSPAQPRPEPGAPLLPSTAESHLSWFAARAAAGARLRAERAPRPADPPGPASWPHADQDGPAAAPAAVRESRAEGGERPVPTAPHASPSGAPAPLRRSVPAAGPQSLPITPLRVERRAPAAQPDGPGRTAAEPEAESPAHRAPRRRTPGADPAPNAGPSRERGLRPQDPGRAARPVGPGPYPDCRTAEQPAAAPPLPPAVVLRPRPGDPLPSASSPSVPGRAGRRSRAAEAPAPAPVVVRIGRVELVVAPAAAAPAPAAPAAPAAARHPDLLAAHRRHDGGWPG
ncbi:hypothetical protein BX285_4500 [Streptomyces sp. 1114.5]|uniref:hypothetical protein n=1 Tax=Streptomyces sp. 1114.5 TaxID=1938830 RepID=UPI000EADCEFA|nr:hypothetical protein [Streptomyces sp. 1114.5]RKT20022.1 hypothetical protein BX285_4500 [Streptomyces sp. 1114.5]